MGCAPRVCCPTSKKARAAAPSSRHPCPATRLRLGAMGLRVGLNAWCELNLPSQQIGKGQPRTTELLVEPHTEIVQRYSGRQTSPQTTQLVRALPPEAEGVE